MHTAGAKRKPRETCQECGSASLFSGYFDQDDYAVPVESGQKTPAGVEWKTLCNDCGATVED